MTTTRPPLEEAADLRYVEMLNQRQYRGLQLLGHTDKLGELCGYYFGEGVHNLTPALLLQLEAAIRRHIHQG